MFAISEAIWTDSNDDTDTENMAMDPPENPLLNPQNAIPFFTGILAQITPAQQRSLFKMAHAS